ncbi:hypothetical protein JCM24511_08638 [Saitozyma sp. JCM 24511]|nr:hypothetical protein JCM24511_08638 [Saitozyma sp. JCM 24511]
MSEAGPSGSAQKHKNYKSNRGGRGGDRGVEAGGEAGDEAVAAGEVIVQRGGVGAVQEGEAEDEEAEAVVVVAEDMVDEEAAVEVHHG